MSRVLIIDDDKDLCYLIKKYAVQEGYEVTLAHTGMDGLRQLAQEVFHLVVLDIMLPEISGFTVLEEIRRKDSVPVLMLTAKGDEADKVKGLRSGADDYLTKPFGMKELMARMDSLIRRYTYLNGEIVPGCDVIELKGMAIDRENRQISINGQQVELSAREFDLLYLLAENRGRIFTKKQLYAQVWDAEYAFDDSNIMSFISKLRRKIEPDAANPFYIQTVRGVGYRMNKEVFK